MRRKIYRSLVAFSFWIFLSTVLPLNALIAASRDYLTPKEEAQVKQAQIIDQRIDVFIKAAERRLLVLSDPGAASSKQVQKDFEKWGDLPKGTRAELILDVANILDAAITNIDDVATRDEKNRLLPIALRKLADAATRFQANLTSLRERTQETAERRAIERVIENVQEILSAANNLPPEVKKK